MVGRSVVGGELDDSTGGRAVLDLLDHGEGNSRVWMSAARHCTKVLSLGEALSAN